MNTILMFSNKKRHSPAMKVGLCFFINRDYMLKDNFYERQRETQFSKTINQNHIL